MKLNKTILVVIISAFLLTGLFYRQYFGLNLVLFDLLFLGWLWGTKQLSFTYRNEVVASGGFLLTAIFTVITHATFTYFMHFVSLIVLVGVLNYTKVRSLFHAGVLSFVALFQAQLSFAKQLSGAKVTGTSIGGLLWKGRIFIIPLLIITLFIGLYSFANPVFGDLVNNVSLSIQNTFDFIFIRLDVPLLFTFLFCLVISSYLFIRTYNDAIVKGDVNALEVLQRDKKNVTRWFKLTGLKNEYKAAIFLLFILNVLLLVLNALDVYWVWFNFSWVGQTLKEFVHVGTYLLIFSILISIAVTLYYFRGNLNFYPKNRLLKLLGYIWLFQNGILVISVAIRTFKYIEYFSLAYKRIGVLIFLALVLYGLYTVVRKIQFKKTTYYLFKSNSLAIFAVLVITSCINWDGVIATYNFKHANSSYLHLDYMSTLSDKTLPILDKPLVDIVDIAKTQQQEYRYDYTLTPSEYRDIIQNRKQLFKTKWESKNLLSWNLPEYLAYQKLFKD